MLYDNKHAILKIAEFSIPSCNKIIIYTFYYKYFCRFCIVRTYAIHIPNYICATETFIILKHLLHKTRYIIIMNILLIKYFLFIWKFTWAKRNQYA